MTKHAHRVSNRDDGHVNFVGVFDETWSYFCGGATLITFEFACKSIYAFAETLV